MKISPRSSPSSTLLTFSALYGLTLAALTIVQPNTPNVSRQNITSGNTTSGLYGNPPDPYQLRVTGTSTSLILGKYTGPVSDSTLLAILTKAEFEVVKSVVQARGDGPIAQPTFEWRHGRLYVRMEHQLELSWLTMAEALYGIVQFGYDYGYLGCQFTVLDDTAGVVASGSVGMGYN
ncbi:hypothetical protein BDR22DRAFT_818180 [Usnea florida]